ncbi:hypothetical protein GGR51DRAFT_398190 [Nemania sp. FL0031]|nr:hypothetical protein GGR51DRAFT_398190 [Nemania sp. FL0031]
MATSYAARRISPGSIIASSIVDSFAVTSLMLAILPTIVMSRFGPLILTLFCFCIQTAILGDNYSRIKFFSRCRSPVVGVIGISLTAAALVLEILCLSLFMVSYHPACDVYLGFSFSLSTLSRMLHRFVGGERKPF